MQQGEIASASKDCGVTIDPQVELDYHLARIYVDNELHLPIRFESYDWPQEGGDEPVLNEESTYYNLKLNVDLTDDDFDPHNSQYAFALTRDDFASTAR